jgi:hypothetical protein
MTSNLIQASYLASDSPTRTIYTAVLPGGSKHGARKVLTFKRHDDFSAVLNYPNGVMFIVVRVLYTHNFTFLLNLGQRLPS